MTKRKNNRQQIKRLTLNRLFQGPESVMGQYKDSKYYLNQEGRPIYTDAQLYGIILLMYQTIKQLQGINYNPKMSKWFVSQTTRDWRGIGKAPASLKKGKQYWWCTDRGMRKLTQKKDMAGPRSGIPYQALRVFANIPQSDWPDFGVFQDIPADWSKHPPFPGHTNPGSKEPSTIYKESARGVIIQEEKTWGRNPYSYDPDKLYSFRFDKSPELKALYRRITGGSPGNTLWVKNFAALTDDWYARWRESYLEAQRKSPTQTVSFHIDYPTVSPYFFAKLNEFKGKSFNTAHTALVWDSRQQNFSEQLLSLVPAHVLAREAERKLQNIKIRRAVQKREAELCKKSKMMASIKAILPQYIEVFRTLENKLREKRFLGEHEAFANLGGTKGLDASHAMISKHTERFNEGLQWLWYEILITGLGRAPQKGTPKKWGKIWRANAKRGFFILPFEINIYYAGQIKLAKKLIHKYKNTSGRRGGLYSGEAESLLGGSEVLEYGAIVALMFLNFVASLPFLDMCDNPCPKGGCPPCED